MRKRLNLLVLALIGLTSLGLLVAALNTVRERAGRAKCKNNLRQIGIALFNHVDQLGHFPRGTVPNQTLPPDKRLSWLVATLPFIESTNVRFDLEKAWDAEENLRPEVLWKGETPTPRRTREELGEYRLFLCPGHPNKGGPDRPSLSHYVGIAGVGKNAADFPLRAFDEGPIRPDVGFFGYDREVKPEDIKDSQATTMAVTETRVGNGPWTAGGWVTVRGLEPQPSPQLGPASPFGGTHTGGALVLFVDGSARFLKESISPEVFKGLATIAGGEEVGQVGD